MEFIFAESHQLHRSSLIRNIQSPSATAPRNLASLRNKLGRSAADFGKLLCVSGASIYLWEEGKTRPHEKNMLGIAMLSGLGRSLRLRLCRFLKHTIRLLSIQLLNNAMTGVSC